MTVIEIPRPDGPDVNIGTRFLKISWTMYGLAILVVAGRLYAQFRITRKPGLADGVMVLSLFFGIASTVCLTESYKWGFGRHFYYLNEQQRAEAQFYTYINEPLGIASSAFGRLSFMLLLWRLFATTKFRCWVIIFLAIQTIVINLVTAITIFTQCKDTRTLWNPVDYPSKCWSPLVQEYTGYFQGSCNSATDMALTLFPLCIFWDMKMDRKTKLGLVALLGMSIFAFVASVVKVTLISSLGKRSDYTFNTVHFFIWINVENTIVITAASIPFLRPIFMRAVHTTKSRNIYHMSTYISPGRSPQNYKLSSHARHRSSVDMILPADHEEVHILEITKQIDVYVEYDDERDLVVTPKPVKMTPIRGNLIWREFPM